MVSRRKILSRSRDDINLVANQPPIEDNEDVWYQKEKLFKDHIQEVLNKWKQIDDEIWSKIVVLERNRRVAKAYARAPVLTVNGSDAGFDGFRIGLSGFENPLRDKRTQECRRHIGHGVKIKMDENGNILIKRQSRSNIFIKYTTLDEESAIPENVIKLPHGALELNKAYTIFDMNKFQINVTRELKRAYPNRRRLENQCLTAIAFVKNEQELLKCPIWILIINMVAIDMLKSQLPIESSPSTSPRTPSSLSVPLIDEGNYSTCRNNNNNNNNGKIHNEAGSCSSGNNYRILEPLIINNPPELPPRKKIEPCNIPQPDYDHHPEGPPASSIRRIPSTKNKNKVKKIKKQPDDPYYCGMKARIPNFVAKLRGKKSSNQIQKQPIYGYHHLHHQQQQQQQQQHQPSIIEQHIRRISQIKHPNLISSASSAIWGAKSLDSGLDTAGSSQAASCNYSMFYRFQPQPSRGFLPAAPQSGKLYIGEWD